MIDLDLWRLLLVVAWLAAFAVLTLPLRRFLRHLGRSSAQSLLLLIPGLSLVVLYLMRLHR